jgi:hypothetical protein
MTRPLRIEFPGALYPPTQKATVSQTVDECGESTLRSFEGAQWGMLRRVPLTKHVEEPRVLDRGAPPLGHVIVKRSSWTGRGFGPSC